MDNVIADNMWEQCDNEGNQLQLMKENFKQNSYGIKPSIIPVKIPTTSHISVYGLDTNFDSSFMGRSKV